STASPMSQSLKSVSMRVALLRTVPRRLEVPRSPPERSASLRFVHNKCAPLSVAFLRSTSGRSAKFKCVLLRFSSAEFCLNKPCLLVCAAHSNPTSPQKNRRRAHRCLCGTPPSAVFPNQRAFSLYCGLSERLGLPFLLHQNNGRP